MTRILILLSILIHGATTCAVEEAAGKVRPRIVGYYPSWASARGFTIDKIPADKLTHINYAFGVIQDGECVVRNEQASFEHFRQLAQLKHKHAQLKVLISIGGWTDSGPFSDTALTEASREKFARSCALFASKHALDGIDIDWEYPGGGGADKTRGRPQDTRNFTLLLADLRRHLDAQGRVDGRRYLLTIAAPASANAYGRIELDQIHQSLDFINVMTYDFAGDWSPRTSFNAALFAARGLAGNNVDATMKGYLAAGVPADKLVMGVPFYGRAWGGVANVENGLNQPHTAKPPRGGFAYRTLVANYIDKSARRFWHEQAKVPWLYDEKAGVMISYDDPQSLRLKGQYVREHKLGGVMIWELSQDDDGFSLLNAVNAGLAVP